MSVSGKGSGSTGKEGVSPGASVRLYAARSDSTSARKDSSGPHALRRNAFRSLGSSSTADPNNSLILSHRSRFTAASSFNAGQPDSGGWDGEELIRLQCPNGGGR